MFTIIALRKIIRLTYRIIILTFLVVYLILMWLTDVINIKFYEVYWSIVFIGFIILFIFVIIPEVYLFSKFLTFKRKRIIKKWEF